MSLQRVRVIFVSAVLALGGVFLAASPAAAHGCVNTPGYYKTHLDTLVTDSYPIPFPATGSTQAERMESAEAILSYSGSDPVQKLMKHFLTAAINLASGADMQGADYQQYLAAQSWLQNYLASPHTLSAAEKQQVLAWADLLDQYNNGLRGTAHCG